MSFAGEFIDALIALDQPTTTPAASGETAVPEYIPPGPGQVSGDRALDQIAAMYRDLQMQAGRIIKLFGSSKIPCEVQDRYNRAVASYLVIAKGIFDQLAKRGITVVQKLYNLEGKEVSEVRGPRPISPLTFKITDCPGSAVVATADTIPTATPFAGWGAIAVLPLIAKIVIALIAASGAVLTARTIVVNWPNEHVRVQEANKIWVDTHLKCVEQKRAAGIAPVQADAECRGVTGPQPQPEPVSALATVGIVAIAIALGAIGGYLLFRMTSPAERARRQRIEEAEEEARQLRMQARRIRREARQPYYPPARAVAQRQPRYVEPDEEPAFSGRPNFSGPRTSRWGCVCF